MQLRRRSALGDISSAVSNGASAQTQGQGAGAGAGARKSRKRKADGGFSVYKNQATKPAAQPSRSQREEQQQQQQSTKDAPIGRRTLREEAHHEASKKLALKTLERLKRCKIAEPVVTVHDVNDKDDPCACAEYVVDMYKHFKELEEKYTPTVYMHTQMDINCKMRAILIDWIVEVHLKFKLADPTLYLTCHIIDRFCMLENVHRSKLQLVGVTALLIACKYEEIYPTEVRDCVYITDHAYTREEVLDMEQMILRRLKFQITVPTPWTFLVRFLKVAKATDRQHHRAQYYLERCLQEHDGLSFRPSMLAATSVFLARIPDTGLDDAWSDVLANFCNIPRDGLDCCARLIIKFLLDEPVTASQRHLVAVKKKFMGERFLAVAIDELPKLPAKPNIPAN